ncbi:MAG: rhodanese family protein [Rhodospirillaceae bacterium]
MISLSPEQAAPMVAVGEAQFVDIREVDEYRRAHIQGATSFPASLLYKSKPSLAEGKTPIFYCRSGARTASYEAHLATQFGGEVHVLEGGLDNWTKSGHAVSRDAKAPLEIMRQVQIIAGALILTGVLLGMLVHPAGFGLSAFVGAGLMFAGISGWCGMAKLLAVMPWNAPRTAPAVER